MVPWYVVFSPPAPKTRGIIFSSILIPGFVWYGVQFCLGTSFCTLYIVGRHMEYYINQLGAQELAHGGAACVHVGIIYGTYKKRGKRRNRDVQPFRPLNVSA